MPDLPLPPVETEAPGASADGLGELGLPPGPVADRLAEAARYIPERPDDLLLAAAEAHAIAEAAGDRLGMAFAQAYRGFGLHLRSEHEAALDVLTHALAEMEPLGHLPGRSLALSALASVHVSQGHYDEALELALDNLRVARAMGDVEREAWVLVTMANTYVELDQPRLAIGHGETALRQFGDLNHAVGQARSHTVLGGALRALGRFDEALAHLQSALRLAVEQGSAATESRALDDLGLLAHARGDAEAALDLYRRGLALRREGDNRQSQSTSLIHIGQALTALGRTDEAAAALEEALGIAQETGAEPRAAQAHLALAEVCEAAGRPADALRHLRAFQRLREHLLSAQARSRIQTLEIRAEAERASQDAEIARMRTEELGAINEELQRTVRDLQNTQRQLVQAEKLASLGRLSAGLAHEIQNPLNFVGNFSELNAGLAGDLRDDVRAARDGGAALDLEALEADLESIRANAERVRDHARRAEGIVRSLMGHVRDVGGERRPADLHELLERAVSTQLRGASGVRVERAYGDDVPPVDVVPNSIQRVFANLLENAAFALHQRAEREADGPGADYEPVLRLETERYAGGVQIRVADNGPGIPLAHCTRVFEPFFTTKPPGQGTGLGLSLAYDIVTEGHGGTLAVTSREGEGATFTITLPSET